MVINPIVGVYIPIIRIPIKGGIFPTPKKTRLLTMTMAHMGNNLCQLSSESRLCRCSKLRRANARQLLWETVANKADLNSLKASGISRNLLQVFLILFVGYWFTHFEQNTSFYPSVKIPIIIQSGTEILYTFDTLCLILGHKFLASPTTNPYARTTARLCQGTLVDSRASP